MSVSRRFRRDMSMTNDNCRVQLLGRRAFLLWPRPFTNPWTMLTKGRNNPFASGYFLRAAFAESSTRAMNSEAETPSALHRRNSTSTVGDFLLCSSWLM